MELRMTTDLETALPEEIGFNFEELKAELTDRLQKYNAMVVTEDAIQEAKTDRANLRKLRDAIETRRKEVKRECERPYKSFECKVKELVALIDAPIAAIDGQVKTFEEQERAQKYEQITAAYDELVPDTIKEIIPLQRILDQSWMNKTTSMKKVSDAIKDRVTRTKVDMTLMDMVDPKYLAAVRTKYIETLDITTAMNHRDRLMEADQAFQQREAERAMFQPPVQEKPPVTALEPAREPAPVPQAQEKLYALRLEFHLTMDQANALKKFLSDSNITYTKI